MSGLELPALLLAGVSAGAGLISATKAAKDLSSSKVRESLFGIPASQRVDIMLIDIVRIPQNGRRARRTHYQAACQRGRRSSGICQQLWRLCAIDSRDGDGGLEPGLSMHEKVAKALAICDGHCAIRRHGGKRRLIIPALPSAPSD